MKFKSLITVLISGVLLVGPLSSCGPSKPKEPDEPVEKYTGISFPDELKNLAGKSDNYKIINDIDLSDSDWTPIENFSGKLDGNGKKITGLKISGNKSNQGLFSTLKGTVKNLKLDEVSISCTGDAGTLGAVCGTNEGNIENVAVSGEISAKYYNVVGGIAGATKNQNISNCKNECTITGYDLVGGIVGSYTTGSANTFKDNENSGTINGNTNVGGIIGFAGTKSVLGDYHVEIKNNKNSGEINGSGNNVAGIIGAVNGSTYNNYGHIYYQQFGITECVNSGIIKGYNSTGGILGNGIYTYEISFCENKAPVTGNVYVGGYIGHLNDWTTIKMLDNDQSITGKAYVGGIIGYHGALSHCTNSGKIISTGVNLESSVAISCVGGLAGLAVALEDCTNNADITVLNKGQFVGGLVGKLSISEGSFFKNCKNNGNIKSDGLYVGGLIGCGATTNDVTYSWTCTISDCENNGLIVGSENYTGGIGGRLDGIGGNYYGREYYHCISLTNCINNKEINGADYTGGIFGYGNYISEISSCSNIVDITGHNYVGGYVGFTNAGSLIHFAENHNNIYGFAYVGGIGGSVGALKNCTNYGTIFSTNTKLENNTKMSYVGGLAGYGVSIEDCANEADLSVSTGGQYVAGLIGYMKANPSSKFTKCVNNGNVTSSGSYVGGLVGFVNSADTSTFDWTLKIENNTNNGVITSDGDYVGGIIGCAQGGVHNYYRSYYHTILISNCENNNDVFGNNYVGGILGRGSYVDKTEATWDTNTNYGLVLGEISGDKYSELA